MQVILLKIVKILGLENYENICEDLKNKLRSDNHSLSFLNEQKSVSDESKRLYREVKILQERVLFLQANSNKFDSMKEEYEGLNQCLISERLDNHDKLLILQGLIMEKEDLIFELKEYKTEIEFVYLRNYQLETLIESLEESYKGKNHHELFRGLNCQIKFHNDYEPKIMLISPNLDQLLLRNPHTFSSEIKLINLIDILNFEIPKKPDIYEHVSIYANYEGSKMSLSFLQENAKVITEIVGLHEHTKKNQKFSALSVKNKCDILESKIVFVTKMIKLYKKTVCRSIFDLKNDMSSFQSILKAEVESLKQINTTIIPILVSMQCLEYINKERKMILEKIDSSNQKVAFNL